MFPDVLLSNTSPFDFLSLKSSHSFVLQIKVRLLHRLHDRIIDFRIHYRIFSKNKTPA